MRYILLLIMILLSTMGFAQTLSLDSCICYALENNKRMKEARMNLQASQEVKKEAFTKYFPTLTVDALAMEANKGLLEMETDEMNLDVYDGNPSNLTNATLFAHIPSMNIEMLDYLNAASVSAVQPLYAGSRIRNGNKLAELGEEISRDNINLTSDEVVLKTENYYWTLVALVQKLNALGSYEKMISALLKDVTISYDAGLIQKSDVLKVQLELNHISSTRLELENGISFMKMTLAQHIGIPFSEKMRLQNDSIENLNPQALLRSPEAALQNRNEYKLLNKSVKAEVLQKKIKRGEYLPQLAIGAQGVYSDVLDNTNTRGIVFAKLSIPLSDWWGGSHKLKEHDLKIDIAQNNLNEKSELLILQMRKAYNDLTEGFKQISVAQTALEQNKEHLRVMQDNYDAGIVNTSDLLEARAMHQQSIDNLVDAKATCKIREAYYLQSVAALIY